MCFSSRYFSFDLITLYGLSYMYPLTGGCEEWFTILWLYTFVMDTCQATHVFFSRSFSLQLFCLLWCGECVWVAEWQHLSLSLFLYLSFSIAYLFLLLPVLIQPLRVCVCLCVCMCVCICLFMCVCVCVFTSVPFVSVFIRWASCYSKYSFIVAKLEKNHQPKKKQSYVIC